jgi:2-polyprenyl-3-methyl-5-hydroxy-6-metoxy-1,4-benzoquinol methylase
MNDLYFKGYRDELKPFIPDGVKRVLEIGCGEGGFRTHFADDVEYWGVEPNSQVAFLSKEKFHRVLNGIYDDVEEEIPNDYFDLVVCNDVIEHMVDHDAFFEKIKLKMKYDGKILMSIPNVRYIGNLLSLIFFKDWQYKDEGILDRTHLRFFTEKSLIRALNEHNFDILKFERINKMIDKPSRVIPQLLVRLFGQADTLYLQFGCLVKKR